jgi:Mg2+-importing ATPase
VDDAKKVDEVPYDFIRKRLSILAETPAGNILICKGALSNVLAACSQVATANGAVPLASEKPRIDELFARYSADGYRVLAVATKPYDSSVRRISAADEQDLVLAGFLVFEDPTKPGIADTIVKLNQLGIRLKIITGDNRAVACAVAKRVGFSEPKLLDSSEITNLHSHALAAKVGDIDVFCEVEPNQKEAIIIALKQAGNVVGYIGDGINDACALRAADVGISVNNAVDVAKESAQLVMLDHDLAILIRAVEEGRRTFANTMKYIFMATSANFGNMFSMAGASLFLPFLPLLPKQVLLTNLFTDFPELTIVTDKVDDELVNRPGRWDLGFIRKFMLVFGGLSSIFDFATFGILMWVLHATPEQFRTGWFMESVISACIIVLVVRTRRPFIKSLPSAALLSTTILVIILTALMPFLPTAHALGFAPLPPQFALMLILIIALYVCSAEIAKALFYRWLAKRT